MKKTNRIRSLKEMEELEIFKIQIPVSTNVKPQQALALIYNEDKSIEVQFPLKDIKPYFKEYEYKRYVYGFVDLGGTLQLFNLPHIENQDW